MPISKTRAKPKELDLERFAKPHGAPRGLLLHYILFRISSKPSHGYELIQDIEEKTEGAWRPGPGSIYPLLKKLVSHGYIRPETSKRLETSQVVYYITPKGKEHVEKAREIFASAGQKWGAMRRIFTELLEPKEIVKFCVDGSKMQFDIARETLESKLDSLPPSEAKFVLKEYSLNLQRQLDWTSEMLQKFQKSEHVSLAKIPTK